MDLITLTAFRDLLQYRDEHCISAYLPTVRAGREVRQNKIRFKNILQDAEKKLPGRGLTKKEIKEYIRPLKDMVQNEAFWRDQEDGLALFYSQEDLFTYRLPLDFDLKLYINDRFYVRPLLPMFLENENFYVLALELSGVRLLAGSRYSVSEINLDDVPLTMEEYLRLEDPERRLSFHNTSSPSAKGTKGVFHQHLPEEEREKDIQRFFHRLDEGVKDAIGGDEKPLIVIGAEHILPLYREANTYPHLLEEIELGNPNNLAPQELHERAWKALKPQVEQELEELLSRFHTLKVQDRTLSDIANIVPAAIHGRVETLMTAEGSHVWGNYDRNADQLTIHQQRQPTSRDMLEYASTHTLLNGGSVYALDENHMPEETQEAAAITRF